VLRNQFSTKSITLAYARKPRLTNQSPRQVTLLHHTVHSGSCMQTVCGATVLLLRTNLTRGTQKLSVLFYFKYY